MANLDRFAKLAWEQLPNYPDSATYAPKGTRYALEKRSGTCLERSRLIGTAALSEGLPAYRVIYFTNTGLTNHFASCIFDDGSWHTISTSDKPGSSFLSAGVGLDGVNTFYCRINGAHAEVVNTSMIVRSVAQLLVPELKMVIYASAKTRDDFIEVATSKSYTERDVA